MGKRARKEVESDEDIASSGSEEDIDLSENDVEVDAKNTYFHEKRAQSGRIRRKLTTFYQKL